MKKQLKKTDRRFKMSDKTFEELRDYTLLWARDKDLLHEKNAEKQFMKFIEEVFEFKKEMTDYKRADELLAESKNFEGGIYYIFLEKLYNMKLEMGDIFVTLIILCEQLNLDPVECLEKAYKKIKSRKGKTINGTFIKEADLIE